MGWDPPNKIKYLYKRIRFGRIEGESKRFKVFTIVNPVGASKVSTSVCDCVMKIDDFFERNYF